MPIWTGALRARRSWPVPWVVPLAVVFTLGPGEAAAQLTPDNTLDDNGLRVDVDAQVTEGANTPVSVTLKASVPDGTASATPVTVTVEVEPKGSSEDATAEAADVSLNPGTAILTFPANTTGSAVTHEIRETVLLQTNHDPDAEDETVVLPSAHRAPASPSPPAAGRATSPCAPSPSTTTSPSRTRWRSHPAHRPGRGAPSR